MAMTDLNDVDWNALPAPEDDGGAKHLPGLTLPRLSLPATDGRLLDLSLKAGLTVVYAYPMTGRPDRPLPDGWDMIPGARGCTPQACAFRDHADELMRLGVDHLFGLSTQDTEYQKEAAARLHLPYALLSDADFLLTDILDLPTLSVAGMRLLKRMTLVLRNGKIAKVFYPVFPPDEAPAQVEGWLRGNRRGGRGLSSRTSTTNQLRR